MAGLGQDLTTDGAIALSDAHLATALADAASAAADVDVSIGDRLYVVGRPASPSGGSHAA